MQAPILQQFNAPALGQVRQMLQLVRSSNNPGAALQMMAQKNPQLKQVMDVVNQSGGEPQKAFYTLCQQRGVDPQQILNALK